MRVVPAMYRMAGSGALRLLDQLCAMFLSLLRVSMHYGRVGQYRARGNLLVSYDR